MPTTLCVKFAFQVKGLPGAPSIPKASPLPLHLRTGRAITRDSPVAAGERPARLQGQVPLACPMSARADGSAIHPAAVCGLRMSIPSLDPPARGLRQYASLLSSSLIAVRLCDWAGRPTLDQGGQGSLWLPSTAAGQPPYGCLGAPLRFRKPSKRVGTF